MQQRNHQIYAGKNGYETHCNREIIRFSQERMAMKQLIDVAHRNGIRVLLDYVANHVHQEHPLMQQHPDWKTLLDLPDGRKNIRIWDEHRLTALS